MFSETDIWRGFKVKTKNNTSWLYDSIIDLKMDRNFVFMHLFDVHEPYLFIEDRSVDSKLNEDYFNAIGSIRNTINLKSKIDQRKRPHDSWQEIKEKMRSEGFDEKVILKSFYDMGVKKFDQYRLPEILDNFEKIGITQKNTLFIFLSDHGEGRSSFDIDNLHFSHGGDITEEVLRIFVSFSQKLPIKIDLLSISDIKDISLYLLGFKDKFQQNHIFPPFSKEKHVYAETFFNFVGEKFPHGLTENGSLVKIAIEKNIQPEYVLGSRALISEKEKIILHAKPEYLVKKYFTTKISNQQLIDNLYKSILGRYPDKGSKKNLLKRLNKNEIDADEITNSLLESKEKKQFPFTRIFSIKKLEDKLSLNSYKENKLIYHQIISLSAKLYNPIKHLLLSHFLKK